VTGVGTLAPIPPRLAEIQSRFTPRAARSTSSSSSSSASTSAADSGSAITTSTFDTMLSSLLGSTSADTTGDGSTIDLSTLRSVLSSAAGARRSAGLDATSTDSSNGPTGSDAVAAAKQYLGVDYAWGGTDPSKGLDCSGLVQRAYRDIGIELPRVSYDQAKAGTKVDSIEQAKPGDLVAFGSPVDHIAIYVGDGKIIQAPHTGDVVRISDIKRPITAIRRVVQGDSGPETSTGTLASTTGIAGAAPYEQLFQAAGAKYGLNPRLLAAVAKTESNFDPAARSGVGAVGLMQFMPATAKGMGIDPTDPAQAIDGAAKYLRTQLDRFGSVDLALAAYNAGPGAVQRSGGIPPYAETRNYVAKVTGLLGGQSATAPPTDLLSSPSSAPLSALTTNGVLS
jgi:cell wall-associated NlpC family hydrolase